MKERQLFDQYRIRRTEDALAALLRAYERSIYNVCYQILGHAQSAEDASQKTFMELLGLLERTSDGDHFRRLVHQVAFHVALNARKESQTRRRYEHRGADAPALLPDEPGRSELVDVLHEHLARLDDESRSLVVERYFEGLTLESLAARRGCSTVAIWKKLEHAKGTLRRSLVGAGFAGMVALLDSRLEAMSGGPPSPDLVGPIVLGHTSGLKTAGMVSSGMTLGGVIMRKKAAMVLVAGLLVAAAGGSAFVRFRAAPEPLAPRGRSALIGEIPSSLPDPALVAQTLSPGEQSASLLVSPAADPPQLVRAMTPLELWHETERRAGVDFEAALQWSRTLPSALDRDRALSCLSLCQCGIAGADALRATQLASEIKDPALRLHAQGEVARWWTYLSPEHALAWVVSLPESAVPSTPPQDEGERMIYYFSNSRRMILMSCIGAWTAPIRNEEGVNEVPEDRVGAARRWILEAPLVADLKSDLLGCLPGARKP